MQDCELLYLSDRPENLVLRNIAVPPLALRPSVFVDGGTRRLSHTSVYLYPLLFSLLFFFFLLFRIPSIVCLFLFVLPISTIVSHLMALVGVFQ